MAGASSSSGGSFRYDVFINFRGEDTRRCFVCHLYEALKQKALDPFIDSEELRKGDDLSELFKAIQDSRLSIVLFSKHYASSTWCLKELVHILECMDSRSQIVVPIFYDVNPSHICNLEESFAEAFAEHESNSKIDKEELESWKSSLNRAANISGYHSTNYGDDNQLIGSIVEDIFQKLFPNSPTKTDGLIGMDSHMYEIDKLLQLGVDDFRIVGIWGMGGIGKSTIARAVFDRIAHQFEHKCFLDNVKEGFLTKNGAVQKAEEFLSRILKVNNPRTLDGGLNMMRERLGKKRILLVLDDVDNLDQIDTLIGEKPTFGRGSRIIITTRNKKLLGGCSIYEPKLLTDEEALELFSKYAFRTNKRSESYDAMSRRAVKYAYGLPLALKVLGGLLANRTVPEWEYELEKIKEISITSLHNTIGRVLWASYDGLDEYQKKIFLDIAFFFKGKDKDFVTKVHESCGFFPHNGLRVLEERSLVSVSYCGKLEMHDLIQEVGRDIVCQQSTEDLGMRSRLWRDEDVLQVLAQNTATNVEGIILDLSKSKEVYVNDEVFVSMRSCHYGDNICLYGSAWRKADYEPCVQYMSENLKFLSNELRILVWHGCPLKSFPINFQPKNIIYVDMCYSRIEQLWEGTKPLQNLVYLDLSYSKYLIKTPDFTGATSLEKLKLTKCTSLLEVHPSISALKSLVELDLLGCTNLKKFPNISGNMKELSELYLDETAITEMPSSINDLSGLKILSVAGCRELRSLPSSIHMKSLRMLDLFGCSKLTEFPKISEVMEELRMLKLDGTTIKELPSSINNLTGLQELSLKDCSSLVCLPDNICNLACLDSLNLTGCSSLVCLPDNICNLACLDSLNLTGCSSLVCLPDNICNLARLDSLNLTGCSSLVCLPDNICNLARLDSLNLTGCSSLVCLPDNICNLARLESLNLTGCSSLVCLPDNICNLACLQYLSLTDCRSLSKLPENIGNLKSLEEDDGCLQLEGSGIKQLPLSILRMESFSCKGCKEMTAPFSSWPTWNHQNPSYSVLTYLDLSDCNLLELSDGIAHLSSLGALNLCRNENLESLPAAMNRLGCLKRLYLRGCKRLKSIPELSSSIQYIVAENCTSLETGSTPQPPYAAEIYFQFFNCFKLVNNTKIFIDIVESATHNQDYESEEDDDYEDYESEEDDDSEDGPYYRMSLSGSDGPDLYSTLFGHAYRMSLPGSDIPHWFNHQSRGSSVTVQLPPNWLAGNFLGFAICAISNLRGADNRRTLTSASCCCTLKANDGQDNFYFCLLPFLIGESETNVPLELDHMFLGYTKIPSLGEWHNERRYTEARFRIVTGIVPSWIRWHRHGSMTLEDCTWITSSGVRLFHINPPSSVDLICNLENRETEMSKRKRETLERGKEKMGRSA